MSEGMQDVWQPIERARKDAVADVLLWLEEGRAVVGYWATNEAFGWSDWVDSFSGHRLSKSKVTHFMPLPSPPKEKGE